MPRKEAIKLRAARDENKFGDPIGPEPVWVEVPGAIIVPRSSQEYEQRGEVIIHGFMVVVAPTVAIDEHDEVEIRGKVYQIDGAIADYGRKKIFYTTRAN